MTAVSFIVPGKPFGKQRPRATARPGGEGARVYTPKETVSFERQVGTIAGPHFPSPISGPVSLTIVATFAIPPSWPKYKREAMRGKPHTAKPDTSNIVKAIEDGLNLIAFADDAQVAEQICVKLWGEVAETRVTVEAL